MAGGVVRELVTLWGFDIDQKPLKELDAGLNTIKATLKGIGIAVAGTAAGIGYLLNEAGEDEQTVIAFETMLGSAELAAQKLAELKEFAARTPFDLPGVKNLTARLLAFNFTAEELIPTMTDLGNIAAGVGTEKLPQLILALGQVRAAGRLTGQELRQFTEAGVPLISELAKTLNKAESEVQEMVFARKVGFKEVAQSLSNLSKEGGRFFNLMDRQSKSLFGIIRNTADIMNIWAIDLGNELLPTAKALANEFLIFLEVNEKVIKQNLGKFVKNLVGFFWNLVSVIQTFYTALKGVVGLFGGFNNALKISFNIFSAIMGLGLLTGIGLIAKALYGLAIAWKSMGTAALFAQLKMAAIPLAIGAIITAIALIAEDILAFSQGRDSVFGRMIDGVGEIFDKLKEKFSVLSEIGQIIVAVLLTPIRAVINAFKSVMTLIDAIRGKTSALDAFKAIGGNFANHFGAGASDSLGGALGLSDNLGMVSGIIDQNNTPQIAAGQASRMTQENSSKNVKVDAKNEINLNLTGMSSEDAKSVVEESIMSKIDSVYRETARDGESQVER